MLNAIRRFGLFSMLLLSMALLWQEPLAASPMSSLTYDSSGTIDASRIAGPSLVTFQGVNSGQVTTNVPFALGDLTVSPVPQGAASIYQSAPLTLSVTFRSPDDPSSQTNATPITVHGSIDGSVANNGSPSYSLLGYFGKPDPSLSEKFGIDPIPFEVASRSYLLKLTPQIFDLTPGSVSYTVRLEGVVIPNPNTVPEPTTIVVFAVASVGSLLSRLRATLRRGGNWVCSAQR